MPDETTKKSEGTSCPPESLMDRFWDNMRRTLDSHDADSRVVQRVPQPVADIFFNHHLHKYDDLYQKLAE